MDLKLKNKTVFVSGSSKGIGFETAKLFLEEGATVIINGRTEKSVKNALKKLNTPKVSGIAANFIADKQIDELIKKLPDIDILVNNVGIFRGKNFYDETEKDWKDHIQVNLLGGVKLSKHFLPKMIKKNWGRIIFVSSECATLVPGDLLSYSVSKASVNVFSSGLAKLTKGTNVTVNTIIPGSTLSEGSKIFLKEAAKRENKTIEEVESNFFKDVRPSSLLGRFAKVEEVASTIVYISSPLASATNGASVRVDGGSMGSVF
ncbi:MAG TPA: SDR family oxidoreductase [Flavobacteriaceae bacterium]|jgi:NAD(P)-dependent dehydrogenase (short-subunit alcohol dehydrogenase family)|nr:oxidoreductase [Flavobacteriaceae bacterium]HJO70698.1 SDR family oxidoreductase [Flavobacteriaceae bacterium]|tara:strand:+ start:4849 stop:5631 length:783 start_codon:yes stop_codon:yes gene_type:complete